MARWRGASFAGRARWAVVALTAWVGLGAVYGGSMLLANPNWLRVEDAWLDGSPFPSYAVPGAVLLGVLGLGMLATTVATYARSPLAVPMAAAEGVALLAWGVVETAVIGWQGPAQVVLLAGWVGPAVPLLLLAARAAASSPAGPDRAVHGRTM